MPFKDSNEREEGKTVVNDPEKLLLLASRTERLTMPVSEGKFPESRLLLRYMCVTLLNPLNDDGTDPSRLLYATEMKPRLERRPREAGNPDVNAFAERSSWMSSLHCESVVGMAPWNWLLEITNLCNALRLPMAGERVPA